MVVSEAWESYENHSRALLSNNSSVSFLVEYATSAAGNRSRTSSAMLMLPLRHTSDTIRMYILIVLLVCGLPLNLYAFCRLKSELSVRKNAFIIWKMNLNITNIMMLTIYTTSDIAWLITVDWRAGDAMCKIVKFFVIFCLSINSYIVVCMAVYSFICNCMSRHSCILCCFAWLLAFANAVPEVANWTLLRPSPTINWAQCTLVWFAHEYQRLRLRAPPSRAKYMSLTVYNVYLGVVVFWIPALVIVVLYLCSVCMKCGERYEALVQRRPKASKVPLFPCQHCSGDDCSSLTVRSTPTNRRSHAKHYALTKIKRKTFNTSRLLILAYMLCWLPYNALAMVTLSYYGDYQSWHAIAASFLTCLIVMNSIVNPIIYLQWKIGSQ